MMVNIFFVAIFFTINAIAGLMLYGLYIRDLGVPFGILYIACVFSNKWFIDFVFNYGRSKAENRRWVG